MAGAAAVNLVLSVRRSWNQVAELRQLVRRVQELDPGIHAQLLKDRPHQLRRLALALRPTLSVGFGPLKHFTPLRGPLVKGLWYSKADEYRRLDRHSLPVPEWMLESELDRELLEGLGPYVVRKPNMGQRGHRVKVKKVSRIHEVPRPAQERDDHILQRFIYTGRWPCDYRVTTCFGTCLFSYLSTADPERRPLEGPNDFASSGGISIVAGGRGCTITLNYEKDVIELGERAHAAFPEVPLLGIDIAREQETGNLFILEVNASGKVWEFGERNLRSVEHGHGVRVDQQFDGLELAARVLARETRLRAR